MKAYYAARAKEYDQIYAKPERQADLRLIEQLYMTHQYLLWRLKTCLSQSSNNLSFYLLLIINLY